MSNPPEFDLFKNDWEITEGILDAGYVYGSDRITTDLPVAPASGVKVRSGNPTQNDIAVAASTFGYRATDQLWTVWANRLRETPTDEDTDQIVPNEGDKLVVDSQTWIIRSIKRTVYATQFIFYCQLSTATVQ